MKIFNIILFALILVACTTKPVLAQFEKQKGKLVWADEFNGTGLPDSSKWTYDIGNGCPSVCGWGNNELQHYTAADTLNARCANGNLIIEARYTGDNNRPFTSARLVSRTKASWKYGYIEASIKLPAGRGVWPAFWMLSEDWKYGGWPASGEIDIMEFVGYEPDSVYGSIHCEDFNHIKRTQVTNGLRCTTLSSDYHLYGLYWDESKIIFYFDDIPYLKFENPEKGFKSWPFDQRFYAILNVAAGGNWGGKNGIDYSIWPQKMYVDYIRVYQIK